MQNLSELIRQLAICEDQSGIYSVKWRDFSLWRLVQNYTVDIFLIQKSKTNGWRQGGIQDHLIDMVKDTIFFLAIHTTFDRNGLNEIC